MHLAHVIPKPVEGLVHVSASLVRTLQGEPGPKLSEGGGQPAPSNDPFSVCVRKRGNDHSFPRNSGLNSQDHHPDLIQSIS